MNKRIIGMLICMLLIATVVPVEGLPNQTGDITNSNVAQPPSQASLGGVSNPPPETTTARPSNREYSEKTPVTRDDAITNILEQVDKKIYLGYLENLTNFGPRVTGSSSCTAAAQYIYSQFDSMGLIVQYYQRSNVVNVEATLPGTDESNDEIYIICAHYDTVASSPGADDDASGTVAVLMAAFIMSQNHYRFNHTIKFVAFSGEEQGLLGSNAYAAEAVEKGWNIAGVLNADMISYAETANEGNYLIVFQDEASEWLYNCTLSISTEYAEYIQLTLFKAGFTGGSDHYSFWEHGYNAVFYYESRTTPHYHKSGDTIAHINATYTVKNIRLILGTLAELSEARYLNNPPEKPVLTGSATGVVNQWYNLSVVTTDPDEDEVYYFIDWGDGQVDEWVGPYTSRVIVELSHKWDTKGTYTIRAKAKDKHEVESDWGTLTVTMPVSYTAPLRMSWEQPCQQFHNTYLLLRHLLGY